MAFNVYLPPTNAKKSTPISMELSITISAAATRVSIYAVVPKEQLWQFDVLASQFWLESYPSVISGKIVPRRHQPDTFASANTSIGSMRRPPIKPNSFRRRKIRRLTFWVSLFRCYRLSMSNGLVIANIYLVRCEWGYECFYFVSVNDKLM